MPDTYICWPVCSIFCNLSGISWLTTEIYFRDLLFKKFKTFILILDWPHFCQQKKNCGNCPKIWTWNHRQRRKPKLIRSKTSLKGRSRQKLFLERKEKMKSRRIFCRCRPNRQNFESFTWQKIRRNWILASPSRFWIFEKQCSTEKVQKIKEKPQKKLFEESKKFELSKLQLKVDMFVCLSALKKNKLLLL